MSDILYPIALTESLRVTPVTRIVQDEFESGAVASRLLWADRNFKRQFVVRHAPMTLEEFSVLRGFYKQRNGQHDTFWFRDNVNRDGNALVRFASPMPGTREKMVNLVGVELIESAPLKLMPEVEDVILATGARPLVWWDANRILYYEHPVSGTTFSYIEPTLYDASGNARHGTWSPTAPTPGGILSQWQYNLLDDEQWVVTAENLGIAATRPALTLFCFTRHPDVSAPTNLVSVGGVSGSSHHAIFLNTGTPDQYRARPHGGGVFDDNNPTDTWRSLCATYPDGADTMVFYKNGAAFSSGATGARTYGNAKFAMGATEDGDETTPAGLDARITHAMVFDVELTAGQVLALHNLLAYQFGL